MHCKNCGATVRSSTRFCPDCGSPVDLEVTQLAFRSRSGEPSLQSTNEQLIYTGRPTFLFIGAGYLVAALMALLLMILLARLGAPAAISVLAGLALLLFPAARHLKRNSILYKLTDSRVEISEGMLRRRTRSVPLRAIQDVTVSRNIGQRLLGIGDVLIDDASEQAGRTALRGISKPGAVASLLLRKMER